MTIRFITAWNGYTADKIVIGLSAIEEARMISLGFAVSDLDGPGNGSLPVTATTDPLTRGVSLSAGGDAFVAKFAVYPTGDVTGVADLAALNAASISATAKGMNIGFLPGDYYYSDTPTLQAPNYTTVTFGKLGLKLVGEGAGNTRLHMLALDKPLFNMPEGTMFAWPENMSLIGPGQGVATADSVGVWWGFASSTGSHHLPTNLEIRDFYAGARLYQCAFFTFLNCMIWKNVQNVQLGNNCDAVTFIGGRNSNATNCGIYFGWKDATHSPGVVTENNAIQIIGTKFGNNAVSFDFSDYWSGPVTISAYFEAETKIAWLGDGVNTTSMSKQIIFDKSYFTVNSANVQIECRNPLTVHGSISIKNCRSDTNFSGGFLLAGPSLSVDWHDNQLSSTVFQVQQSASQNIVNLGDMTEYRYNADSRVEGDATSNTISDTCTVSINASATVTSTDHEAAPNSIVYFSTTGAFPTGIVSGTAYYVLKDSAYTADAFHFSTTPGGSPVTTSGTQSGTHTLRRARPLRTARLHSGTNQVFESWVRYGNDAVGQAQAYIADVDGKWVLYRGLVQLMDPVTALPVASAVYRGVMAFQTGASGAADTVKVCVKSAADTYSWATMVTG